jgi:exodeoxyribonuclease VII small subunit
LAAKTKSFEDRLEQLETLVTRMEEGGMALSAALKDYEAGVRLVRELNAELDAADKKMLELRSGQPVPMEDAP